MVTDSPIYDEYPSQTDDEMEEDIALNTSDCEITCQSFVPLENTSSKFPRISDQMSGKRIGEGGIKENQAFMSIFPDIHDDTEQIKATCLEDKCEDH